MTFFTSVAEARRRDAVRIDEQSIQDQTVSGRNKFQGLGKVFFTVKFPVAFSGKPVHAGGWDLDPTTPFAVLGAQTPPEATSGVVGWDSFGAILGAFEGYFIGATICAVIRGSKEQTTWIDWSFHGPALRNPQNTEDVVVL